MKWFTFDKVKALIALSTFLAGAVGYFGYDGHTSHQEAEATKKQLSTIVNYYQGCKK